MASAFPDVIKGWELPVHQGPPDTKAEFEDLLNKLRRLHVRVCARNSYLESELLRTAVDPFLQEDCDMMPVPTECALAISLRATPKGAADDPRVVPRTPPMTARVDAANTAEVSVVLGELKQQQQKLNDSLAKVLDVPPRRNSLSRPLSQIAPAQRSSVRGQSQASAEAEESLRENRRKANFQVSKGSTRDLSKTSSLSDGATKRNLGPLRSLCVLLVSSYWFTAACSAVLMSYAVFIAIETEQLAQNPERDTSFTQVLHIIYSAFFAVELFIRFGADGKKFFFDKSSIYNWLDAALVVTIFVDLTLAIWSANLSTMATAGPIMRTLRIVRVVRTMRLVRTVRHLHEFQKMAYALASSLKTLMCSTGVVFFVMFFFAVIFTQGAADYGMRESIVDLELRYGDLPSTLYTLFLCLSNGISWDLAYQPVKLMGLGYGYAFLSYIVVSLFGVLNVVTSIFVESVIRSAQHHKDVIVQDKEKDKHIAVSHMQEVFRQVDKDGSGHVTSEELEFFLGEPDLHKYMEALDVSTEDTRLLFRLLDRDGSHVIDIDEFCEGCLRLKGNARSIDVQTLIFQMKNFLSKWAEFTDFVAEGFDQLATVSGK